jgi:hypothetical protein
VSAAALSALVLATGCSAASAPAVTAAPPAETVAATSAGLDAPSGFRVSLDPVEVPTTGPDGRDLVTWEADWTLTWEPPAGAVQHAVWFGTNEGAPSEPRRWIDEPELRLTAATGTSAPDGLAADREVGLLFTSSQLLVSVAARAADGSLGPRSPWFPVGDVPADGRPVGTAAPGHEDDH